MKNKKKTIGILGGMGPEASANLYYKIIKYTQDKYGATQDNEYPPVIINSLALKGFDETGIVDSELVKKQLVEGVKKLEKAGCDLIIIACNTVHCFYRDLQKEIKVTILNILEETRKAVEEIGYKKVGLFASQSTSRLKLYENYFNNHGIEVISPTPEQQKKLNLVIEHVMGGKQGNQDVEILKKIAQNYVDQGAQAVVMGCTEIPLAIDQSQTIIKLFDTIEIIVKAAVDYSIT